MFYVLMYQVHCDPYQNDDIIFFFTDVKQLVFSLILLYVVIFI